MPRKDDETAPGLPQESGDTCKAAASDAQIIGPLGVERVAGYEKLEAVLLEAAALGAQRGDPASGVILGVAYQQAAVGKGHVRHADGRAWGDQPIFQISRLLGGTEFQLGQAMKKVVEMQGLEYEPALREAYGAIVYLAAAIVMVQYPGAQWYQVLGGWMAPSLTTVECEQHLGQMCKSPLVRAVLERMVAAVRFSGDTKLAAMRLIEALDGIVQIIADLGRAE